MHKLGIMNGKATLSRSGFSPGNRPIVSEFRDP